jgi:hypothetical protein
MKSHGLSLVGSTLAAGLPCRPVLPGVLSLRKAPGLFEAMKLRFDEEFPRAAASGGWDRGSPSVSFGTVAQLKIVVRLHFQQPGCGTFEFESAIACGV